MSASAVEILTPPGRLVQGSLYIPQTVDALGNPIVIKTGPQAGQTGVSYYFAIAVAKGQEQHWNQTPWGKLIWDVGHQGFPGGQADHPVFAWKIIDGDTTVASTPNGPPPCDRPGFAGHWVMKFNSGFAPTIYDPRNKKILLDKDFINAGDYIQISGTVKPNGSPQQPGVYLNHKCVAFLGYGEPIIFGKDPSEIAFETGLPAGASLTPKGVSAAALPATLATSQAQPAYVPPAAPPVAVVPHTAILTPPAPPVVNAPPPARIMLPAATGTYEQYIAANWNDTQLIQHGLMQA